MTAVHAGIVVRHLRGVAAAEAGRHSDRELLDRFASSADEAAFAALVRRHGPLVWGVCRRVLGNHHDAEDAFQAAFLALARKAGSVGRTGAVGGWLYRVAYHSAVRARARAQSQRRREQQIASAALPDPLAEISGRELLAALDEELQRLPERYRTPLVLCYLEGRTRDEAARQLGWSLGTLKRRLGQGRQCLRSRLQRRGLALTGALLAAGLYPLVVPPALAASAARLARVVRSGGPGGASAPVAALAASALRAVAGGKFKALVAIIIALGAAAAGTSTLARYHAQVVAPESSVSVMAASPRQRASPKDGQATAERAGHVRLSGRVLDADGRPVANAHVAVLGSPRLQPQEASVTVPLPVLGRTGADAAGRFRLVMPGLSPAGFDSAAVVAAAPGHGLAYADVRPDVARQEVVLRLGREQVLRGRLVDLQGAPAAKVVVRVESIHHGREGGVTAPRGDLPGWPGPVTTDAEGRFVLRGIGAGCGVELAVEDDRFACQRLDVAAGRPDPGGEIVLPLGLPHVLGGRVSCADTGKPVAGARVLVMTAGRNFLARTGTDGRYRVAVSDTSFVQVYATPPDGQPYLILKKRADWPRGHVRYEVDLALPPGIEVRGRVTESPSGKPVAGAGVLYFPQVEDNRDFRADVASMWHSVVTSGPDGAFRIMLPPGPAHLLVTGPTLDYVHRQIAFSLLAEGRPNYPRFSAAPEGNAFWGGQRIYAHAIVPVRPRCGARPDPVQVTLRRGVTVHGRLLDAEGKPVAAAFVLSRLHVSGYEHVVGLPGEALDGRFELRGCDPAESYRVTFHDPWHNQGAFVELAGKQAGGGDVTVRLAPCGTASVRLVYRGGAPVRNKGVKVDVVVTPGPAGGDPRSLMADEVWLAHADYLNYTSIPRTDDRGRLTLPGLVPGATYRIHTQTAWKDFTVEAGKTTDVGEIVDPVVFADRN
jgi:RNA polymerase sigma factor (sigma-70 family)